MFLFTTLKKQFVPVVVAPLLMLLTVSVSHASLSILSFTYDLTSTGPVLAGTMTGTLLSDNNTFVVSTVGPLTFGGFAAPAVPLISSVDSFFGINPTAVPTVTLNGSYMDLIACTAGSNCPDGFLFAVGDQTATDAFGANVYESGASFGGAALPYNASGWQASLGATPEPGDGIPVLIAGALALVIRRNKLRRRAVSGPVEQL